MGQGDEMELEAQAQIWKYIFSFVDSFTLRSAVELGIPDIIHSQGRPITLSQLSACLPIDCANPDRLHRLMRYLVRIGIFSREHGSADDEDDQEDKFGLTCLSKLLVRKLENNMVPFSMLDFKVLMEPWYHLTWSLDSRASGVTAFERVYGTKFWDYAGQDLEFGEKLNEVMACDTSSTMPTLLQQFNQVFADMSSVVDVGGGTGTAAMAIAKSFPNVKCTVFDHPHVVVDDQSDSGGVAKVSGDMFNFIPRADNLLLKWILHNYGDEDCLVILKRCKEALPERGGGKVVIVETVMEGDDNDETAAEIHDDEFTPCRLIMDMEMMLLVGGKERTAKEWQSLLERAGFRRCTMERINSSMHSLIQAYP